MRKIMYTWYAICFVVASAAAFLMDTNNIKDLVKTLVCAAIGASTIILLGDELQWTDQRITLGVILASCYARPIVYGVNKQIKEFFLDPKKYIEKYKGMK